MNAIDQVIQCNDLPTLRKEIELREEEIKFHHCNQVVIDRLQNEVNQIRGKVYQLINIKSKGKISYMSIPGLV